MKSNITIVSLPIIALIASCDSNKTNLKNDFPNVIIIMGDDVGYGDINWNITKKSIQTPNVERLAQEGVSFTNCYSTSATSTPSRYGMLTGIYPWRKQGTGIAAGDAPMLINPDQFTIADMFKEVGYTTGAVGKWHLGLGAEQGKQDWNGIVSPNLADIGFDYSYIMAATADRVPCVYFENGSVVNLDASDPILVSYSTPFEGEPTAKTHPELMKILPSQGHDQSIINGIPRIGYMKGGKSALWKDEDLADNITQKATNFIVKNKKQPFFLYFGTNDIHVPRVPHERFQGKSGMGSRGDAILSFDYSVGRVLTVLDSLGIADNTIVIVTSDNGPVLDDGYQDRAVELVGEHQPMNKMRAGKYSIYEGGTKVPCVVRWNKKMKNSGGINNGLISQIDFLASFASLLNYKIKKEDATDSRNLMKLLQNKTKNGAPYIIQQNMNNTLSIIKNNWKVIEPSDAVPIEFWTKTELGNNPGYQLYNLKTDPSEQKNIAEKHKETVIELMTLLDKEKEKGFLK